MLFFVNCNFDVDGRLDSKLVLQVDDPEAVEGMELKKFYLLL
jgi:hypothetical protein